MHALFRIGWYSDCWGRERHFAGEKRSENWCRHGPLPKWRAEYADKSGDRKDRYREEDQRSDCCPPTIRCFWRNALNSVDEPIHSDLFPQIFCLRLLDVSVRSSLFIPLQRHDHFIRAAKVSLSDRQREGDHDADGDGGDANDAPDLFFATGHVWNLDGSGERYQSIAADP